MRTHAFIGTCTENFSRLPSTPFAVWCSTRALDATLIPSHQQSLGFRSAASPNRIPYGSPSSSQGSWSIFRPIRGRCQPLLPSLATFDHFRVDLLTQKRCSLMYAIPTAGPSASARKEGRYLEVSFPSFARLWFLPPSSWTSSWSAHGQGCAHKSCISHPVVRRRYPSPHHLSSQPIRRSRMMPARPCPTSPLA